MEGVEWLTAALSAAGLGASAGASASVVGAGGCVVGGALRKATLCFGNGDRYSGEVDAAGRRSGTGVLHTARGDVLSGAWLAGALHGAGVIAEAPRRVRGQLLEGRRYDGALSAGLRNGQGVQRVGNGDVYSGAFVRDACVWGARCGRAPPAPRAPPPHARTPALSLARAGTRARA